MDSTARMYGEELMDKIVDGGEQEKSTGILMRWLRGEDLNL